MDNGYVGDEKGSEAQGSEAEGTEEGSDSCS